MVSKEISPSPPDGLRAPGGVHPWGRQSGLRDGEEEAPGRGAQPGRRGGWRSWRAGRSGPGRFPQPLGRRGCVTPAAWTWGVYVSPADFKVTKGRGRGPGEHPEERQC